MGRLSRLAVVEEQLRARLPKPPVLHPTNSQLRDAAAAVRRQLDRGELGHLSDAELQRVHEDLAWVDGLVGP